MIIECYYFSAHSACSAVSFLYVIVFMTLCTKSNVPNDLNAPNHQNDLNHHNHPNVLNHLNPQSYPTKLFNNIHINPGSFHHVFFRNPFINAVNTVEVFYTDQHGTDTVAWDAFVPEESRIRGAD